MQLVEWNALTGWAADKMNTKGGRIVESTFPLPRYRCRRGRNRFVIGKQLPLPPTEKRSKII